jgi:hypothetical protein
VSANQIKEELARARNFGQQAEDLVIAKGQCPTGDRNTPLMGYWSLGFEIHKAILHLIELGLYGAAFALVRPLIECTIRAHLVIFVCDEVLAQIRNDEYRTNFGTVGKEIDDAFAIGDFFQGFLRGAKDALHGYTHIGTHQLGRRFRGADLVPNYSEGEIVEVIHTSTSAAFMLNNIVTKHFVFEDEWKRNNELFAEWGKEGA